MTSCWAQRRYRLSGAGCSLSRPIGRFQVQALSARHADEENTIRVPSGDQNGEPCVGGIEGQPAGPLPLQQPDILFATFPACHRHAVAVRWNARCQVSLVRFTDGSQFVTGPTAPLELPLAG